jgi:signal transduction histidine kinase
MIHAHFQTSKELILTLQRSRDELEEKVRERTRELSEANVELEAALAALKTAQADLVQSHKMASLGRLSAGIAHEINNPAGAVSSGADINQRCVEKIEAALSGLNVSDIGELERVLQIMKDTNQATTNAAHRIADVVTSLKKFSKLDESELQKADIHEGLESTLTLLNRDFGDRITVTKDYGEVPEIECYPAELNQVFMNILRNAVHAIKTSGEIRIRTFADGTGVHVDISDTGEGIPSENIDKIFDPGFTTWGVGVGTGLGMAISHNIIEKHNGRIDVESVLGKGTTFALTLPLEVDSRSCPGSSPTR